MRGLWRRGPPRGPTAVGGACLGVSGMSPRVSSTSGFRGRIPHIRGALHWTDSPALLSSERPAPPTPCSSSEGALSEHTTWPRTSGLAAPQSQPERPPQRVPEAAVGEGELQGIRAPSNPGCCPNWQASGFRRVRGCGKVDDVRKGGVAGSRGSSGGVGVTS